MFLSDLPYEIVLEILEFAVDTPQDFLRLSSVCNLYHSLLRGSMKHLTMPSWEFVASHIEPEFSFRPTTWDQYLLHREIHKKDLLRQRISDCSEELLSKSFVIAMRLFFVPSLLLGIVSSSLHQQCKLWYWLPFHFFAVYGPLFWWGAFNISIFLNLILLRHIIRSTVESSRLSSWKNRQRSHRSIHQFEYAELHPKSVSVVRYNGLVSSLKGSATFLAAIGGWACIAHFGFLPLVKLLTANFFWDDESWLDAVYLPTLLIFLVGVEMRLYDSTLRACKMNSSCTKVRLVLSSGVVLLLGCSSLVVDHLYWTIFRNPFVASGVAVLVILLIGLQSVFVLDYMCIQKYFENRALGLLYGSLPFSLVWTFATKRMPIVSPFVRASVATFVPLLAFFALMQAGVVRDAEIWWDCVLKLVRIRDWSDGISGEESKKS